MERSVLERTLEEWYEPAAFEDAIPSGLLIEGKTRLQKGATAVSFEYEAVKKAVAQKADFLVVHHGHGFWNNQSRVLRGAFRDKVALALKHKLNLFAFHLPMDAQPEIGNNVQLLKALGLSVADRFLPHGKKFIGLVGSYPKPIPYKVFLKKVEQTAGRINFSFSHGSSTISRVALCTGGAAGAIAQAKQTGAQVYLTGEAKEDTAVYCRDEQFNFVAAGHYRTEVFGPKALAKQLTRLGLPTRFIPVESTV